MAPNEGQTGREREQRRTETDGLRGAFSERVRRACEGNVAKLLRIYDVYRMPVGLSLHLKAPGYMDLVIERLDRRRISMTHYGKQNGDLMADPDMEVEIAPDRSGIRALTYQNDYAGVFQSIKDESNPVLERELTEFLADWLKNLEDQGFGRPSPEEAARRQEEFDAYERQCLAEIDELRARGRAGPSERERERER